VVAAHQARISLIAKEREPAVRQHDGVEFVTMRNQQPPPIGGGVDRLTLDLDAAEIHAGELAKHFVVIAGHIDYASAAFRPLHDAPDDVVVRIGPIEFLLHPPAIDDVADQIHRLAVGAVEEIDQQFGGAASSAQMDIADPDRAEPASLAVARRLGNAGRGCLKILQIGIEGQSRDRIHACSLAQDAARYKRLWGGFVTLSLQIYALIMTCPGNAATRASQAEIAG